ncbi:XRE family transcriptional regulator [Pseudotabrizicola sediminis]|uniref:XRE family transcriptional regulator n=1 Tax=Pseudotabrizicola sediminis TaxID=2486418 RepID=A0ABY2KRI9_9RHOB|nr:helix-turn-helix transcriptional regulator [Pseudotabrizicola sediminis]TGD45350.1 XRE family transcriptional regulator [Pseudotabrizicola sediminis]
MSLSERLFELRQGSNTSLQKLADAVGVSKAHIWELEKGRTANPSFELVQKLAAHFGVTPEALTGATDVPHPAEQQIERIHRDLKDLSDRDRSLIEEMVRSMRRDRTASEA